MNAPGEEPVDESATEQAATTAFANDHAAYNFFVGKGFTSFQAAGIVGNLDQESGVDPSSVQYGGGPGRGIAQWSVGGRWDTSAGDNAVAYAAQQGEGVHTLNLQLEFINYELTAKGYGYARLKATTNVTDATIAFMDDFEICGTCVSSQRVAYAKAVLAAYGATPSYGASYVNQSWPLASQPAMVVKCGEKVDATITLKNMGSKAWDSHTMLGTTEARDRDSIFAGANWVSPNRAAGISGTVAPGANGTFSFSFYGPTGAACVPGTYHEHFGLVEDGVGWFSDSGNGGPPDDQIEALIDLQPGDGTGGSGSGSGSGSDSGSGSGDGGMNEAAGGCQAGGAGGLGGIVIALGLMLRARRRA